MSETKKRVDGRDVLILIGLSTMGTGLFFWLGLGVSLTVSGAVLLLGVYLPDFVRLIVRSK